jgi:uncharacterized protein (DUF927 family)
MDTENHVYEYFVLPEIFKKELCNGFEPRWAAKVLIEKKLLRQGNDGKPQVLQRLPGKGPTRCYHFPAQGLCEETGLETKTTEENREGPF